MHAGLTVRLGVVLREELSEIGRLNEILLDTTPTLGVREWALQGLSYTAGDTSTLKLEVVIVLAI